MHHHGQQQPHCVYGYVALAPFDSFACVVSALPSFETVLTDWESMMAALGLAPAGAAAPAGRGVVDLFPERVALGQCALSTVCSPVMSFGYMTIVCRKFSL